MKKNFKIKQNMDIPLCVKCSKEAHFKCSTCDFTFCAKSCWDISNHVDKCPEPIGTQQELIDEYEQRMKVTQGKSIEWIPGLVHTGVITRKDQPQIWILGEKHIHTYSKHRHKLDVNLNENVLSFVGTDGTAISLPRLIYAFAESAKRKQKFVDLHIETSYFNEKYAVDVKYAKPDLSIPRTKLILDHMKCHTLLRDKKSHCDVFPFFRVHISDYRNDENSIIEFLVFLSDVLLNLADQPGLELYLKCIERFALSLESGWLLKYFDMAMTSDDFGTDFLAWIEPFYHKFYYDLLKEEHDTIRDNIIQIGSYLLSERMIGEKHQLRKQFDGLKKESKKDAENVMNFIKSQYISGMIEVEKYLGKSETWDFTNLGSLYERLRQNTLPGIRVFMDAPLICRLLRTFNNTPSNIKMVYAGAAHTTNVAKYFKMHGSGIVDTTYSDIGYIKDDPLNQVFLNVVNEFIK